MPTTTVAAPSATSGNNWSNWYERDVGIINGGAAFEFTLSVSMLDTTDFVSPYRVQVLYPDPSGPGYVMIEEFFTSGGDIVFDFPAATTGAIYFRVNSMSTVPTGVRVEDDQTYTAIPPNEVPDWEPLDPNYEVPPPVEMEGLPAWLTDPLDLFGLAPAQGSPLVCDLDADVVELTTFNAASTTTFFDLDGDGFASQTAWVSDDDGLLVRDLNENGTIDGAVAGLVGIKGGVVSGVMNLESPGVGAPGRRPRHDER